MVGEGFELGSIDPAAAPIKSVPQIGAEVGKVGFETAKVGARPVFNNLGQVSKAAGSRIAGAAQNAVPALLQLGGLLVGVHFLIGGIKMMVNPGKAKAPWPLNYILPSNAGGK